MTWLQQLFSSSDLTPHGFCLYWRPELLWLQVVPDFLIGLSYYSIPLALAYFVSKRRDVAFGWAFWMFAVFILACGTTHLFEIWTLWHPDYAVQGMIKAFTAVASVATAVVLWPLVPKALALPSLETLNRLNEELSVQVRERDSAVEGLEAFSYSVSHDLRTPLRAIDGFSRILLDDYVDKLDDEGKRLLNVVRDNTNRMGQLIDDILKFSRIGRVGMTFSEIDMEKLAREVFEELQPSVAGGKLQLEICHLPRAKGNSALMRQVFVNLLSNAIKFSRSKETAMIKVGGSIEGDEAVYYVKDNGVGFDMQYAGKLFGVFQRLVEREEYSGSGIGLAIVKRIITHHGGRVWAEGKVKEGATFYFTIPIEEKPDV
ncbi:MAG: sensor histidine kinase [Stellaceae bacterium]